MFDPSFALHALKWFPDLLLLPSRPLPVQQPVPSQTRDLPTLWLPWQVPTLKPNKHQWHRRPGSATSWSKRCGKPKIFGAPQDTLSLSYCEGKCSTTFCSGSFQIRTFDYIQWEIYICKSKQPPAETKDAATCNLYRRTSPRLRPTFFWVVLLPHIRFIHFIQA